MTVLIACSEPAAARLWAEACAREGLGTRIAGGTDEAIALLGVLELGAAVIALDARGAVDALTVATLVAYRQPGVPVVLMIGPGIQPDGSLQALLPNVRAYLSHATRPADLAALVMHSAGRPDHVPGRPRQVLHPPTCALH
jgi:hypothetical protein